MHDPAPVSIDRDRFLHVPGLLLDRYEHRVTAGAKGEPRKLTKIGFSLPITLIDPR